MSAQNCDLGWKFIVFQGASSLSLDAKGRLSVPTRHRDVLMANANGQMTITKHPHGCLIIYPRPEWDRVRGELDKLPASGQWLKRIYLGNAVDVEMDGTGRVLVSPELRQAAGLTRGVMLLGLGRSFELWDKETYEAKEAAAMQDNMSELMNQLSL